MSFDHKRRVPSSQCITYLGNHGVSSEYLSFFFCPAIILCVQLFEFMMTYSIKTVIFLSTFNILLLADSNKSWDVSVSNIGLDTFNQLGKFLSTLFVTVSIFQMRSTQEIHTHSKLGYACIKVIKLVEDWQVFAFVHCLSLFAYYVALFFVGLEVS